MRLGQPAEWLKREKQKKRFLSQVQKLMTSTGVATTEMEQRREARNMSKGK